MTEPRHISAAICQLAHPTLVRAWHYVMDWHALEQARCPADIRRHGLRVPAGSRLLEPSRPEQTEALALVDAWGGTSGVMVGPPGIGKSFAAVQWLLGYAHGGKTIRWEQCSGWAVGKAFDAARERMLAVQALVLDDIGAGNMNAWLIGEVNAIVATRFDAGKRTLVSTNEAEYRVKIDGQHDDVPLCSERITSRLQAHVKRVDGDPLRRADDGRTLDAWHRARLLLELVGVTDSAELPVWPGQRQPDRPLPTWDDVRFGGSLATRLQLAELEAGLDAEARSRAKRAIVEHVCGELEIDPREVSRRAAKLERDATDHAGAEALKAALASSGSPLFHDLASFGPARRDRQATSPGQVSEAERRAAMREIARIRDERSADPPPRVPSRRDLIAWGYSVRSRGAEGFEVTFRHAPKVGGYKTEADAWAGAARMHADPMGTTEESP
jgi:hypothetical protein